MLVLKKLAAKQLSRFVGELVTGHFSSNCGMQSCVGSRCPVIPTTIGKDGVLVVGLSALSELIGSYEFIVAFYLCGMCPNGPVGRAL